MKFAITVSDLSYEEAAKFVSIGNPMGSTSIAVLPPNVGGAMPQGNGATIASNDDDGGPANANAPAVDTAMLPWDERIHSKNKALNADGTWRKRRGVDGTLIATVEAELKLRGSTGAGMYMPPQGSQVAPQMPHDQQNYQPPQGQYQQPPQGQPQYQPPQGNYQQPPQGQPQYQPPQGVQAQQPMDFNAFMAHLAGQMAKRDVNGAPLIHTDYLLNVCQRLSAQFGRQFNSITDIANDPAAIGVAVTFITNDGRWN